MSDNRPKTFLPLAGHDVPLYPTTDISLILLSSRDEYRWQSFDGMWV
jgi:hypothetical protein